VTTEMQGSMQGKGKLYIDLTDLIIYAANFDRISGVQRVEIELIKLIFDQNTGVEIISTFEVNANALKKVLRNYKSEEDLFAGLNREFAHWVLGPNHKKNMRFLTWLRIALRNQERRLRFRRLKLNAGDTVFIPAGFGFAEAFSEFYKRILAQKARLVFLLHDVIPITQPNYTPEGVDRFFVPAMRLPADIITTTNFNARDYKNAYQQIVQVPHLSPIPIVPLAHEFPGVPRNATVAGTGSKRLEEALHGKAFVLCVGTVEIRKNHIVLFNVWRALKSEFGDRLPLLVVAGRRGWKAAPALSVIDHLKVGQDPIHFVDGPSDDELKWLYSACDFTVFPSLYEGWGLPVGESLWFGKACAASHTSSIPEVGQDLCYYFDPEEPEQMKTAIRQLLTPEIRAQFEAKIRDAKLRKWSEVAADLMDVLLKIADRNFQNG